MEHLQQQIVLKRLKASASRIGSNSLGKVGINLLRQGLGNRLKLDRNLFSKSVAKLLGGSALLLEHAAQNRADNQVLVKLGLGGNNRVERVLDVVGELARRAGNGERLFKGKRLRGLGGFGRGFDFLEELVGFACQRE